MKESMDNEELKKRIEEIISKSLCVDQADRIIDLIQENFVPKEREEK